MTGWLIGSGCVLVIVGGTLGARWAGWRWHGWRLRRVHAQHAGPVAPLEYIPDRNFYGSMDYDAERIWRGSEPVPCIKDPLNKAWFEPGELPTAFLPAEPDWREQTMAELGALTDPGPGVVAPSHGPPPGPDQAPARGNDQGWAVRVCASESRPAARADLTGSLFPHHEEDPGPLARGGPGPGDGWLDAQLEDLFAWVRTQWEAA